jgi:hypothetical protein
VQFKLYHSHLMKWVFDLLRQDTGELPSGLSPSHLQFGYTRVERLSGSDTLGPGWPDRLDGDLLFTIPVRPHLNLLLRGRSFSPLSDVGNLSATKLMLEGAVMFRWKDEWVHVKYERGGLPPLFEPVDHWSLGVGFAFK